MNEWDDEVEEEGEREKQLGQRERESSSNTQRLTSHDTRANALSHTPTSFEL